MSKINFLILGTLFLFSSCVEKNENTSVVEDSGKFHKIKSFLGFRKGMSSKEVVELLDSKSIKHSSVLPSIKLKYGEDFNPEQYRKSHITFLEVFDYPIGEHKLDKYHLFFINDILYQFSFFRGFSSKKAVNDKNLNQGWLFKSKYGPIVRFINETLTEKYGQPNDYSNEIGSDAILDSPDLNLDLILTDKLENRSRYSVIWKYTNLNEDLTIYIDSEQELAFSDFDKKTSYDCSFQILVDFSNEKIDNILKLIEAEGMKSEIDKLKKIQKSKNDI